MIATLEEIGRRAYSTAHTIRASYSIGAESDQVKGDIVECGVAAGSNAAALFKGYAENAFFFDQERKLHLFDSFTGIPLCGPEDVEFLAAKHPAGLTAHSQAEVARNMAEWGIPSDVLVYHPGMFETTVPAWAATKPKIAVLRLDGDLYESTKVCIEHLFPLVVPGGYIIVDDWDLSGARKAILETVGHGFGPIMFQKQS
jgi:O-methyltransferase